MTSIARIARWLWVAPNTAMGILIGALGLLSGGGWRATHGVFEFHGGLVRRFLQCAPITGGAAAMAIGHVVLGRDQQTLARCRSHELVHVRQYERWGPFFLPAYFSASLYVWLRGGHAYLDNPFEVQAYREAG